MRNVILVIMAILAGTCPVRADLVFDSGYNIFDDNDPYYGEVWVINDAHLDVLGGAMWKLELTDFATANIYAGNIDLLAFQDEAVVNIYNGDIDFLAIGDFAVANIHGGALDYFAAAQNSLAYLYAYDVTYHPTGGSEGEGWIEGIYYSNNEPFSFSFYNEGTYSHLIVVDEPVGQDKIFTSSGQIIDGEEWNNVSIYNDDTIVDMLGGNVDRMQAYDASTLNVTGGHVSTLEAHEFSSANVSGGYVHGLHALDHAIINFSGSARAINIVAGGDFGTVNISGGTVDYLGAAGSGTLNLHGGLILEDLGAYDFSTVNIYGYDLVKTASGGSYGYGQVYGFWYDGSYFTIDLYTEVTYSHINLIPAVEVEIDIRPETVNLASKGKWISCKIWLPEDYNVADVNSESVFLEDEIPAEWIWFNEEQNVVMAKFARSELAGILEPGEIELTVTGELLDGTYFKGTDTIRVIDKGRRKD